MRKIACILIILSAAVVPTALADTIYSSPAPWSQNNAVGVGYSAVQQITWGLAEHFTPAQVYSFDAVELMLWTHAGAEINSAVIQLRSDQAGLPGALLESWSTTSVPNWQPGIGPTSFSSLAHPLLTAGSRYWVTVTVGDPFASLGWGNDGAATNHSSACSRDNGATWISCQTRGAFAVYGTPGNVPVPEPAAALLLVSGLIPLLCNFRKR
jgi:hypothetical protein